MGNTEISLNVVMEYLYIKTFLTCIVKNLYLLVQNNDYNILMSETGLHVYFDPILLNMLENV